MTQTDSQADGSRTREGSARRRARAGGEGKKAYRKPELSRYEQLHGIGLG